MAADDFFILPELLLKTAKCSKEVGEILNNNLLLDVFYLSCCFITILVEYSDQKEQHKDDEDTAWSDLS